jgi:hypothetical protein
MSKELKTVLGPNGTPLLGLVKDGGVVVIYEADDMDRQITIPVPAIPALIQFLEELK